ncbi:hypothetical protein E8E11_006908 [Didymella keratinophila]|nr:hypothetical protein E8E11_006908 [Didymella keratinophila]
MSLRRKCARDSNTIVISSSSDTSEASEDSTPESDLDTPSSRRGFAAVNDMSERQTSKVNAGNFGMFNDLPLMPRTPGKGKKRKRVKEYSDHQESPRTSRRKERSGREEVIEIDDEDEGEQDLFVPENNCPTSHVTVDDDPEDEDRLYSGMTPDRARNTKEYLELVSHVTTAEKHFRTTDSKLSAMTSEQKALGWKLANIDATAENKISDILRQRDEAMKVAIEHAEEKIKRVRERLPVKKAQYDERLRDIAKRRQGMEERVAQVKATLEVIKSKKAALEQQYGFELCSDVRDAQAKQRQ